MEFHAPLRHRESADPTPGRGAPSNIGGGSRAFLTGEVYERSVIAVPLLALGASPLGVLSDRLDCAEQTVEFLLAEEDLGSLGVR